MDTKNAIYAAYIEIYFREEINNIRKIIFSDVDVIDDGKQLFIIETDVNEKYAYVYNSDIIGYYQVREGERP